MTNQPRKQIPVEVLYKARAMYMQAKTWVEIGDELGHNRHSLRDAVTRRLGFGAEKRPTRGHVQRAFEKKVNSSMRDWLLENGPAFMGEPVLPAAQAQPEVQRLVEALPYQVLFNAIGAAVDSRKQPIEISVKAFRDALAAQRAGGAS